jgi:hypothetical protein
MKKDPVKELATPNFIKKTITIRPDKENQLFTYKQIKKYGEQVLKTLHKDSKMIVKGENILRDTTLKGYNDDFLSQEEYDEYAQGHVKDSTKFDKFYNFTITILEPNNVSLFKPKK